MENLEKRTDKRFELDKTKEIFKEKPLQNEIDLEAARDLIRLETGLDFTENKGEIKEKIKKAVESESFWQKIKENSKLRDALKIILIIFTLAFPRSESLSQEKKENKEVGSKDKDKVEQVVRQVEFIQELEEIFQKYELMRDLLKEVENQPNFNLRFVANPMLYEQGIFGAFKPSPNNPLSRTFQGTIEFTPFNKLDDRDKGAFLSMLYHEMIHAKQDYELWNYFFKGNPNKMSEWQMKYYYANLPEEKNFHLGAELDAHYEQAIFEKKEFGKIEKSTLAGFFRYYMAIQRTESFKKYKAVEKMVTKRYKEFIKLSGYTLESFLKLLKNEANNF